MKQRLLRQIPPIHELQKDEAYITLLKSGDLSDDLLTEWLQEAVAEVRSQILNEIWTEEASIKESIFTAVSARLSKHFDYTLKKVINGTGTVLHTNLGRAILSEQAIKQVIVAATSYSNLEYGLEEGARGSRHALIEDIVKEVTGAEAAMVVNNNAAAVYFVLTAFAKGREVIVSRGELVEIGGSFRVSSIMEESGAHLKEIGTTNKTHYKDYEAAISCETAMLMKVHTSNFKTIGFTSAVESKDLTKLAKEKEVILYEDLGSGALYDLSQHGIGDEPHVSEVLAQGVDLVTFSGDKLLGGPQAGIIAGSKKLIDRLKKHQLARVLRVDKMTLAALEATLKSYIDSNTALKEIPTLKMIVKSKEEIKQESEQFTSMLSKEWNSELIEDFSMVGGGTMPDVQLETWLLLLSHPNKKTQEMIEALRLGETAVVTRVKDDKIAIDFRTISSNDYDELLTRLELVKEV
ncbi:selenocysteine synthase [Alkalihalophilus pseudofirmus OF4]|uniref:L-seryl-tRNA(Sec) selenium transferase n=1 Tax=Alkalihalophilus pseudofirmus (strain ATCC BAA-2126 / JCM 17055 / OF4) TaxID=398511 RepID=D3FTR9_ALKPO|nr:L-seryl-tRNA(Sec) selenium transferase [Alkalihalophilus pseudofirmus]ADC51900.1 selenocysteine synthase [Alkalihalophilus pseudofirmus OF4]